MAKKQTFYYVVVMTNGGPVFVTSVDHANKTAHWDKTEAPKELGRYMAEDLTLGLNLNCHIAFTVSSKLEIDNQPYRYNMGGFVWKYDEDKE